MECGKQGSGVQEGALSRPRAREFTNLSRPTRCLQATSAGYAFGTPPAPNDPAMAGGGGFNFGDQSQTGQANMFNFTPQ